MVARGVRSFGILEGATGTEGGLSLDLEPADQEPKNQNWLF